MPGTLLIINPSDPEAMEKLLTSVRAIARGVCRDYRFGENSEEEKELEGTACILLVEYAARYDERRLPPGASVVAHFYNTFSGPMRHALRREALRLGNGGLYRTTSCAEGKGLRCVRLPVTKDGSDGLTDPASVGD